MLKGYRTYLCAAAVAVLSVLHYIGTIDGGTYQTLAGILGAGSIAALRASK